MKPFGQAVGQLAVADEQRRESPLLHERMILETSCELPILTARLDDDGRKPLDGAGGRHHHVGMDLDHDASYRASRPRSAIRRPVLHGRENQGNLLSADLSGENAATGERDVLSHRGGCTGSGVPTVSAMPAVPRRSPTSTSSTPPADSMMRSGGSDQSRVSENGRPSTSPSGSFANLTRSRLPTSG
jgi:hypothetical protein